MLILWSPAGLMRITTLFMCVWPIATCHKSPDHLLCGHISGTSTQLDFLCQFHPLRSAFQQVCPVYCSLDRSSTAHSDRLSSVGLALFLYGCECRKPLTKQHENHVWGFMIKITVSMSLFRAAVIHVPAVSVLLSAPGLLSFTFFLPILDLWRAPEWG